MKDVSEHEVGEKMYVKDISGGNGEVREVTDR